MKTRRNFIKTTAALSISSLVSNWALGIPGKDKFGKKLPMRRLTRNGEKVTAFCLGGYHMSKSLNPAESEKLVEMAMTLGVRFFDTARGYQRGVSEEYYGKFLVPKYREDVFLMTKSPGQTREAAQKHLDESLNALQTDQLDLWQMHNVRTVEDVDKRINEGALDVFLEARQQGKARYIGFTVHTNPKAGIYFLEQIEKRGIELDTCQMPINVVDASFLPFQKELLPVLLEKKYGIIAMKTMTGGGIIGRRFDLTSDKIKDEQIPNVIEKTNLTFEQLHQYVYSLPVSALCSGCETIDELEKNINVLKNLKKLSESELTELAEVAKPYAGEFAEHYKRVL